MDKKYTLIFDEIMLKQLQKAAKENTVKQILIKMLDKIELLGPNAGKFIDSKLKIYELKNKHPPIRLYFKEQKDKEEMYIFEYEMKTSEKQQQKTIKKIKKKVLET